jgi:hypothetical protein
MTEHSYTDCAHNHMTDKQQECPECGWRPSYTLGGTPKKPIELMTDRELLTSIAEDMRYIREQAEELYGQVQPYVDKLADSSIFRMMMGGR